MRTKEQLAYLTVSEITLDGSLPSMVGYSWGRLFPVRRWTPDRRTAMVCTLYCERRDQKISSTDSSATVLKTETPRRCPVFSIQYNFM